MLLLKFVNKIVNKQSRMQRESMTDIMIYKDVDKCYQDIRMAYFSNGIRYVAHNVVNNRESYNGKIKFETKRVPAVLTIDRVHVYQVGNRYEYRYRICDGDREAIYNFKGIPKFNEKDNNIIKSITVNNNTTGVWIDIEMTDDKPRLIVFNLEKASIISE